MSHAKRNCIAAIVADGHRFDVRRSILMPTRIPIRILAASVVERHRFDANPDTHVGNLNFFNFYSQQYQFTLFSLSRQCYTVGVIIFSIFDTILNFKKYRFGSRQVLDADPDPNPAK